MPKYSRTAKYEELRNKLQNDSEPAITSKELSEYAKAAILASRDYDALKESFINSRSGKRLIGLGYEEDVKLCCMKNITENVAIYENQELTLLKD